MKKNKEQQHSFHKESLAVFLMVLWDFGEELLEEGIAYLLGRAFAILITRAISAVIIVFSTIWLKRVIFRLVKPIIKKITYKEGNDKMNKLKKFGTWLFANKKTLIGTLSASIMTLSGTGVINVSALPDLTIKGFNFTPVIYYGVLVVLALLGMFGKGFEKIEEFFARMTVVKAKKEQNAIVKQAEKEIKAEQKKANQTQAEQDKQKAKEEADAKAKAEKEKADAEYRAKVEQAKAELKAKQSE